MTETMETTELHAPFAAWRDAAVADGWYEVPGGVWGYQAQPWRIDPITGSYATTGERREGDRTVYLIKDDMKVWLVDRNTVIRDGSSRREIWTHGWFMNGHQKMDKVPEVYDTEALEVQRGVCVYCNQPGDPSRLKPISFAGKVCPDCDTKALRDKVEAPGWYN